MSEETTLIIRLPFLCWTKYSAKSDWSIRRESSGRKAQESTRADLDGAVTTSLLRRQALIDKSHKIKCNKP